MIKKISENLSAEKRIELVISAEARAQLLSAATANLGNGGRGIGNIVESMLIDPLSRYMFDNKIFDNATIQIEQIDTTGLPTSLICD